MIFKNKNTWFSSAESVVIMLYRLIWLDTPLERVQDNNEFKLSICSSDTYIIHYFKQQTTLTINVINFLVIILLRNTIYKLKIWLLKIWKWKWTHLDRVRVEHNLKGGGEGESLTQMKSFRLTEEKRSSLS